MYQGFENNTHHLGYGFRRFVKYNKTLSKKTKLDDNVTLFLTGEEGLIDSSNNPKTLTDYDGLTTTQVEARIGNSSFDFSSKRLDAGSFTLGSDDFTIDTWVYVNSFSNFETIFEYGQFSAGILVRYNNTGTFDYWINNSNYTFSTSNPSQSWHHIALVKKDGDYFLFRDGVIIRTVTGRSDNFPSYVLGVGYSRHSTGQRLDGYLDNFRVTEGEAIFNTAGFSVGDITSSYPGAAKIVPYGLQYTIPNKFQGPRPVYNFSDDTPAPNLFIQGDSLEQDALGRGLTVTGALSLNTVDAKFNSAIERTNSTNDNADYIVIDNGDDVFDFGTGDFTIQFWVNHNTPNTGSFDAAILETRNEGSNIGNEPYIYAERSGKQIAFTLVGTSITVVSSSVVVNQWFWIQIIRSGTDLKIYVNGVEEDSITSSENIVAPRAVLFRNSFTTGSSLAPFVGLIEDFQVFKGTALSPNLPTKPASLGIISNYANWGTQYQRPGARAFFPSRGLEYDVLALSPEGWWDLADTGTITLAGGNFIQQLDDKSGNGFNATANAAANRPEYATYQQNGIDVLTADNSGSIGLTTSCYLGGGNYSLMLVCRQRTTGSSRVLKSINTNALMSPSRSSFAFYVNGTLRNAGPVPQGDWSITTMVIYASGSPSEVWWQSVDYSVGGNYGDWQNLGIGNAPGSFSENPIAEIAEVIVFNYALNTTQRQELEGYLAWKWDLVSDLGAGHPYENSAP